GGGYLASAAHLLGDPRATAPTSDDVARPPRSGTAPRYEQYPGARSVPPQDRPCVRPGSRRARPCRPAAAQATATTSRSHHQGTLPRLPPPLEASVSQWAPRPWSGRWPAAPP